MYVMGTLRSDPVAKGGRIWAMRAIDYSCLKEPSYRMSDFILRYALFPAGWQQH